MELRQIRYFVAVAEELHFGKAAAKLHMAEQPLGHQIRRLEAEMGFKLLERTTRSVRLTPAGESFLVDAQKVIELTDRAADTAGRIASGKSGVIRLGFESSTSFAIMPDFVKQFRADYPDVDLILSERVKAGLIPLHEGLVDACLITRYSRLPKTVDYYPIRRDRALVAIFADSPLASREELSLDNLKDEVFLGYTGEGSEPVNQFLASLPREVTEIRVVQQEAESSMALLGLVSAGLGFTIVTEALSGQAPDGVAFVPLVNPRVPVDYGLALRKGDEAPMSKALVSTANRLAPLFEDRRDPKC